MEKFLQNNTLVIDPTNQRLVGKQTRTKQAYIGLHSGKRFLWRERLIIKAPGQLNFWNILQRKKKYLPPARILVITGPGSFSATRSAVNIANTLAYSWNKPVKGISLHDLEKTGLPNVLTQLKTLKAFDLKRRALPYYTKKAI